MQHCASQDYISFQDKYFLSRCIFLESEWCFKLMNYIHIYILLLIIQNSNLCLTSVYKIAVIKIKAQICKVSKLQNS